MQPKRILKQSLSLLNTDYVKLDAKWNYKNVISPYHRIYFIDGGDGVIEDREKSLRLEAGYLYIIPSYTLCNLSCESFLSQYFVQFFEESTDGSSLFGNNHFVYKVATREIDILNFKRLVDLNPGRGLDRSDDPRIYEKHSYYQKYQALNELQSHSDFIETQGILLQLSSRFSKPEITYKESAGNLSIKILEAVRFISINLHQNLSIRFLANRCHCNTNYFSRIFEQQMGIRPQAYIIDKRMERAKHMITSGSLSFSEIAERTGFGSLASFSKKFKLETGHSPRNYKNLRIKK
ncbi:AraC-like DNA-binding protein [Mucilaginibacter rubeus]|uniref:helix-turn-helix domain-containing protein n=1 Tax=Mucilaginibacter rubeus TaxID=2027860 RepID=UPI003395F428